MESYNFVKIITQKKENRISEFLSVLQSSKINFELDESYIIELKENFFFSNFIFNGLIKFPDIAREIIKNGDIGKKYNKNEYSLRLNNLLSPDMDDATLSSLLQKFRQRELIRIAWRDLSKKSDIFETMEDLSNFADACLERILSILYQRYCDELGTPYGKNGEKQYLVVLGMGKLGASELNFSSDIDLIFAYPEVGSAKKNDKEITNDEFFVHLCRKYIKILSSSPDGSLFRVDMRLRPYGENGPLVMDFDAMELYFQREGREWERYALIKARPVAGNIESGEELLERLKPFIFRKYLDFSAFESLREMKMQISSSKKLKNLTNNIKIGPGGIREIEFFGQVFQLIRGGIDTDLQEKKIVNVLNILVQKDYIPKKVKDELVEAYIFLRLLENRLQEFNDQQTHDIPTDSIEKLRVAQSMSFHEWESFSEQLEFHRKNIRRHLDDILDTPEQKDKTKAEYENLDKIWKNLLTKDDALKILADAGFDDFEETLNILIGFRNYLDTKNLSLEGRKRIDKIIPLMLKKGGDSNQPFIAFNRMIELIKAVQRRTSYILLLLENPNAIDHLIRLTSASPLILSFLTKYPILLDELLDTRTLYNPPLKEELKKELRVKLEECSYDDIECLMDKLRLFNQMSVLRISAADVTGALHIMKVSDRLSELAEAIIEATLQISWDELTQKHGYPFCSLDGQICDKGFIVIAYGKLGGIELGYGSDLDLVFLHAGSSEYTQGASKLIDTGTFFAKLGQKIVSFLSVPTASGVLYQTDMRLRPNGISGPLVAYIGSFDEYQRNNAWTWEHMAIVRARPVCGDAYISKKFEDIRKNVLTIVRDEDLLKKEVIIMREKMRKERLKPQTNFFDLKNDTGGIIDIEFIVQYLVLLNAHKCPFLVQWTDNVRLIETLIQSELITNKMGFNLKEAYLTFRSIIHSLSLQKKEALIENYKYTDLRSNVIEIWETIFA
ncbi:MAG: bifunctional [glutamate--ammonia ligase]-adenylyl-L-tyrosine phosphorylase/[glutamate--ammonia-ligase] adenylyltransferase [Desulfobacterales bacterium]|nr:bifunctional [glutamate--ammonia ligase]-adenylyl-L-tyrosine phosphorylase/[glutamate--ammonia-ligase] adenylyltransferase [Desulfobacterales bacterium]